MGHDFELPDRDTVSLEYAGDCIASVAPDIRDIRDGHSHHKFPRGKRR
jgi:hypothetical protein